MPFRRVLRVSVTLLRARRGRRDEKPSGRELPSIPGFGRPGRGPAVGVGGKQGRVIGSSSGSTTQSYRRGAKVQPSGPNPRLPADGSLPAAVARPPAAGVAGST